MRFRTMQLLLGSAAAAMGVYLLPMALAQVPTPTTPGGTDTVNAVEAPVIMDFVAPPQNPPTSFMRQATPPPSVDPKLEEMRGLVNEAAKLLQNDNNEEQLVKVAARMAEIVDRLQQLEGQDLGDPLATNRPREQKTILVDIQRLTELRKQIDALQAAPRKDRSPAVGQLKRSVQNLKQIMELFPKAGAAYAAQAAPQPVRQDIAVQANPFGPVPAEMVFNGPNGPTVLRSGVAVAGVPVGVDPEWQKIASGFTAQIRQASEKLRTATEDSKKAEAKKELTDLLNQYFDQDTLRREQELAKIEDRVKSLRSQLTKRKDKKQEIIDLQVKVAENEADGLGFFSAPSDVLETRTINGTMLPAKAAAPQLFQGQGGGRMKSALTRPGIGPQPGDNPAVEADVPADVLLPPGFPSAQPVTAPLPQVK